mgnify:CR=1 FL=1
MSRSLASQSSETEPTIETRLPWWVAHAIRDVESELILVTGGLGSGKTYGSCIKFHDLVGLNSQCDLCWAVAPTHGKVEDVLIPSYQEVLSSVYGLLPDTHYRLYKTKPARIEWLAFQGPSVVFHSADRPELMVGSNISHWMVTEAGLVFNEPVVHEKLVSRARDKKAVCIQGIAEGTPEGLNHLQALAEGDDFRWLNHWLARNPKTKTSRIKLKTKWNPHLPNGYLERLIRAYSWNPQKLKSYLDGEFTSFTEGACYSNLHAANIVLDIQADPHLPLTFAWDFNKTPLAWVVWQDQPVTRRDGRRVRKIRVLAESDGRSNQLDDGVIEFLHKFPKERYFDTLIRLDGDRSGFAGSHKIQGSDYQHIQRYLRPFFRNVEIVSRHEVTPVRSSVEQLNKLLLYEVVEIGAWCRNTITSLEKTKFKPGTTDIEKPSNDQHTHWQEALRVSTYNHTQGWDLTSDSSPILGLSL